MNYLENIKMILEVGCGYFPSGDVNLDLFPGPTGHRPGKVESEGSALPTKIIPNFIKADAMHLPFRDNAFSEVCSFHVIEHVPKPIMMLDEMVRVSAWKVTLRFPHWLGESRSDYHLYHFRMRIFHRYAQIKGLIIFTKISQWKCLPNEFLTLFRIPLENEVILLKNRKSVRSP
jgi:hypothetical protein